MMTRILAVLLAFMMCGCAVSTVEPPLRTSLNEALAARPEVEWSADWIGFPADDADETPRACPMFRKEFTLAKPVVRATIHVCGLGQYELRINGQKVGDAVLTPGWTAYARTCVFDTYDVTGQLQQGQNAVGLMLGNGMYNVLKVPGRYTKFDGTFGPPKAILQLEVEHADGTRMRVGTDGSWRTARGPVTFTHIYGGEDYDARREVPGWDQPGFFDGGWDAAAVVAGPGGGRAELTPAIGPPSKVQKRYPAVKITHPRPDVYVYDFGQNLSGWPHLKVRGPAGAAVRLIPGELLAANGTVTQAAIGSPMWFSYTLKGREGTTEEWRPRFTYHGFRYVQVQGAVPADVAPADGQAQVVEMASEFVHADLRQVGSFSSSDETLNRIHALIVGAILSNSQSVLTDCPHREKLGWLEQAYLMGDAIAMNYDVSALYAKKCRDMRDSQTAEGLVPDIAPEYTVFSGGFRDSPEWGSAAVIVPWMLYEYYGDTSVLAAQYDTMKRYVEYLGSKARNHIVAHGLGDWYDIGPRGPGPAQLTSLGLTSTATYYRDLCILSDTAKLLRHEDDARRYAALAAEVRAAFNERFYDPAKGLYEKGSQTALAMPIAAGLVDPGLRPALVEKLAAAVQTNGYRVTAGDVGFSYVVRALTDEGRGDVMYRMMTQRDGPGYVYQLERGATTLTEAWNALPSSSHNHLMLGHAEAWLYRGLAGIRQAPGSVGFERIVIAPQIVRALAAENGRQWVKATFASPRGDIESSWTLTGNRLHLEVAVPAGTRATVIVPGKGASGRGAGFAIPQMQGGTPGYAMFSVHAGRAQFISTLE